MQREHDQREVHSGDDGVGMNGTGCRLCKSCNTVYRGRENFARREFRGEIFAVQKGGEIFSRRNFGDTVPHSGTAAEGLCVLRRAKRAYERA